MLAFTDPGIPPYILELIKEAAKAKEIAVSDWAMIRPNAEGKAEITTDQSVDPGAGRGGLFGGVAGVVLAGISGPIGVGAIVAGAAIGAVTAALRDSGIKDADLGGIADLMTRAAAASSSTCRSTTRSSSRTSCMSTSSSSRSSAGSRWTSCPATHSPRRSMSTGRSRARTRRPQHDDPVPGASAPSPRDPAMRTE